MYECTQINFVQKSIFVCIKKASVLIPSSLSHRSPTFPSSHLHASQLHYPTLAFQIRDANKQLVCEGVIIKDIYKNYTKVINHLTLNIQGGLSHRKLMK